MGPASGAEPHQASRIQGITRLDLDRAHLLNVSCCRRRCEARAEQAIVRTNGAHQKKAKKIPQYWYLTHASRYTNCSRVDKGEPDSRDQRGLLTRALANGIQKDLQR